MGGFALLMTAWLAGVSATTACGCCSCGCPPTSHGALYPPQLPVLYYAPLQGGQLVVPVAQHQGLQAAEDRSHSELEGTAADGVASERDGSQEHTQELSPSESHAATALFPHAPAQTYVQSNGKESIISQHHPTHHIHIQQLHPQSASNHNSLDVEDKHHHDKNARYKYEYSVNDPHTKDVKSHVEERDGDVVQGQYSVLEDDGNVRTVKYYADWKNGFHAQVHNSKKKAG